MAAKGLFRSRHRSTPSSESSGHVGHSSCRDRKGRQSSNPTLAFRLETDQNPFQSIEKMGISVSKCVVIPAIIAAMIISSSAALPTNALKDGGKFDAPGQYHCSYDADYSYSCNNGIHHPPMIPGASESESPSPSPSITPPTTPPRPNRRLLHRRGRKSFPGKASWI